MKNVFIIHGFGGHSQGGWLPWLVRELNQDTVSAVSIPMPNSEYPVVQEWVEGISSWVGKPTENTFLVGHSLGASAVLRYLESLLPGEQIGGVLLVAGFAEPLEVANPESLFRRIDPFVAPSFDFEKVRQSAKRFTVIHGAKDSVVPVKLGEDLARNLEGTFVRIENGDHFSQKTEPICYELPEALQAVLELVHS